MYFPGLNDAQKLKLEQLIYRTARLIYLQEGGLQEFFEATDTNKNGFLEKEEIEAGYKGENDGNIKALEVDIAAQKGVLSKANLEHTKKVYKICSESLNEKVQELIKENNITGKIEISLDKLKEYYDRTYDRALISLGPKAETKNIVKIFQSNVEKFLKATPDSIKKDVAAKFKGLNTFEKMLEKRKAGGSDLGFLFFDLVYYYIFYVYTKPEGDINEYFSNILSQPDCILESLKYYKTIIEVLNKKLV